MSDPTSPDLAWSRPAPALRSLRLAEVAAATVLGMLVVVVGVPRSLLGVTAGVCAVAVLAALSGWALARRVASWGYAERDDDLIVRHGVLVRRLVVIPYGRMQFVDVTAGPLERLYGLATVRMHTAAAASHVRIPGLAAAEASRLRDRLTELGEARAAGL
jgi:membrane protein YdbS with pleckstrin-like domain